MLTVWHLLLQDASEHVIHKIPPIGLNHDGKRSNALEQLANSLGDLFPEAVASFTQAQRQELVVTTLPDMLRRDLAHKAQRLDSVTMAWRLLAWIELS